MVCWENQSFNQRAGSFYTQTFWHGVCLWGGKWRQKTFPLDSLCNYQIKTPLIIPYASEFTLLPKPAHFWAGWPGAPHLSSSLMCNRTVPSFMLKWHLSARNSAMRAALPGPVPEQVHLEHIQLSLCTSSLSQCLLSSSFLLYKCI